MSTPAHARAEFLSAAARIIASQGFQGMSMRDLARATDRSLATLYHHFRSKEEVLSALHSGAFEALLAAAERALSAVALRTPSERLHAFILTHVRFVAEHPDVMRVLVHEASALPETDRRDLRALKGRYYGLGREIVRDVIVHGCGAPVARGSDAFDDVEIERAAYALFGMMNWTWAWYDPLRHGAPDLVARTYYRMLLCGLVTECGLRAQHEEAAERRECDARSSFHGLPRGQGIGP